MSEQRPFKHPHPTPNIPRPRQPGPNPTPNMTPEARKAAAAAKTAGAEPKKSTIGAIADTIKRAVSGASKASQVGKQSQEQLADRRDQTIKLKGDY